MFHKAPYRVVRPAVLFSGMLLLAGVSCRKPKEVAPQRPATHRSDAVVAAITRPDSKLYPYSIVPGGVHTVRDFTAKPDAVAREHYGRLQAVDVVENKRDSLWYVSYRKGDSIYWTHTRLRVPQAEPLIRLVGSQTVPFARTRCGNLLSLAPQRPTLPAAQEQIIVAKAEQPEEPLFDLSFPVPRDLADLAIDHVPDVAPEMSDPRAGHALASDPLQNLAGNGGVADPGAFWLGGFAGGSGMASRGQQHPVQAGDPHGSKPGDPDNPAGSAVPEPACWILLLCGVAMACLAVCRKRTQTP